MVTSIFIGKENKHLWDRFGTKNEAQLYAEAQGIELVSTFQDGRIFDREEGDFLVLWLDEGDHWEYVKTEKEVAEIIFKNNGCREDMIIFTEGEPIADYRTGDMFLYDYSCRVLEEPLPIDEINMINDEGYVTGVVRIDLSEIIEGNLEGFLDAISEKLVGSVLLQDVSYSVEGNDKDDILIKVTGDASTILDDAEAEAESEDIA